MKDAEVYSLEIRISRFLRYGVLVAGLLMFLGWMTQIQLSGNPLESFANYHSYPLINTLTDLFRSQQWGLLLSYIGLFVLISLPLLRVLMTAYLFLKQGEKALAGIATFVFLVLIISFSLGIEL